MVRKGLGCFLLIYALGVQTNAQSKKDWVDSVFSNMTINDKIGQLFMISVSLDAPEGRLIEVQNRVKSDGLGGVLFRKGKIGNQSSLTNEWQAESDVPLLIGIEGCSGIGGSADTLLQFPPSLAQGAITHDSLIFQMGKEIGRQMKLMGIHLNFIPTNLFNDNNSERISFGENHADVSAKALTYWKGLQSQGVLACAKYFPVQAIKIESMDKNLPDVQLTVDSIRAYPFRVLMKNGLPALMPAATDLPLFSPDKKIAIKNLLSSRMLTAAFAGNWIRQNTQYDGLLFVDMQHLTKVSDKSTPGDAEVFAFQAGNDMLVNSQNVTAAIRKFKKMIRKEKQYQPQLDSSVMKILRLKYDAGLHTPQKAKTENLLPYLVTTEQKLLRKNLYRSAVTVIKNDQNLLPIIALEDRKYSCVIADDSVKGITFHHAISKYIHADLVNVNENREIPNLYDALISKQVIFVAVFPSTSEITLQKLLSSLSSRNPDKEIVICDFGSTAFQSYAQHFPTVLTAYADDPEMLITIPEVIFGGIPSDGKLPITYGQVPYGTSIKTGKLDRLTYSFPEEAGMDSRTLNGIEAIAREAIETKATPGCHVLVARKGKVIYEKSFGHFTYEKQNAVSDNTIYDLASVTKVAATLQAVMFVYEKGLIDINKKASVYLPALKTSNKKDYTLKDILTHQAGLWPFLPFWAHTVKDSVYLPEFYNDTLSAEYPFIVAEKLYAHKAMRDSLWQWIVKAKVREKPARTPFDYRYSDMGFYILQQLSEKMLNQPLDDFLNQNLYEPLGASTTGYLPLLKFPMNQIAPTENDKLFRKSLLIGMVHDQGAAMQGGVAGHAGLFSSANDLAKLGQMLLQEGEYGGTRYFKPETVRFFAAKQFASSHRALGWNRAVGGWDGATSVYASPKMYGHTGFTGTCIWIDPEFDLVYIFLSNRVHPDMTNNKLLNANIRSRIQDVVYQSIFEYCKNAGGEPAPPVSAPVPPIGSSQ
jgi:beta-N-acetylhexosaminidase